MLLRMARVQKPTLELAKAVHDAREDRGLSQEDLALEIRQKTGRKLTAGAISQIERGRIRPELSTMDALADAGFSSHHDHHDGGRNVSFESRRFPQPHEIMERGMRDFRRNR